MNYIKTIETFLNKGMTEQERNEFISEMRINSDLAKEVALHIEVNEAIADDLVHEFRKSVREIVISSREITPSKFYIARSLIKYPLIAAIFVLIGFSLWQVLSVASPEKLYSEYYKPYATDVSTRSAVASTDKSLVAIQFYQEGNFESSYEILSNYLIKNYGDQTARFYYGMNALELGKTELAIEALKQVEQDPSSEYCLHARWYLSMALLKMNRNEEALKYLKDLNREENFYSERAKVILKKLRT
jgi:tetratricopeptide (TPR) repeat protein